MRLPTRLVVAALCGTVLSIQGCSTTQSTTSSSSVKTERYAVVNDEHVPVPQIKMGDRKTINAILKEGKDHSQVMDHLSTLTKTYGPRLTGSTNLENAQRWARDQFASWGMSNVEMPQWGVIETRFDRGPSTGKIYLVNEKPDEENKELRAMEFTTLSWSHGTDGATSGHVMHLPTSREEYEADKGKYAESWILLKPSYAGRGGIRSVGYLMRQRMDDRQNIRNDIATKSSEPQETVATDPNTWNGTFDYHGSPVPAVLTLDESTDPATGTMSIKGFSEGPISDFTREGDMIKFHWKHAMGSSNIELTIDGDTAKGVSKSSSGNEFKLDFARGATNVAEEETDSDSNDALLAAVLKENPLGFISSSKDERVWTTSSNNWRTRALADYPQDIEVNVRQSDFDFLSAHTTEGVDLIVEFDLQNKLTAGPIPVYNVIAEIKGTEKPDEVIIISGHIDSWDGPGSMGTTDNGTGSAVTIEAARILTAIGAKPKRTIRFALWGGEEQGLLGSKGYIDSLSDEEKSKISAAFVDDGGTNYEGGVPAADFMVDYLAAATAPVNGQFYSEIDGKYLDVNIRSTGDKINTHGGSDHASFNREGVPGFFWDEVGRADYGFSWHTQNDKFDMAIEEYLIQSATNAAIVAYNLANAPDLLPRHGEVQVEEAEAAEDAVSK